VEVQNQRVRVEAEDEPNLKPKKGFKSKLDAKLKLKPKMKLKLKLEQKMSSKWKRASLKPRSVTPIDTIGSEVAADDDMSSVVSDVASGVEVDAATPQDSTSGFVSAGGACRRLSEPIDWLNLFSGSKVAVDVAAPPASTSGFASAGETLQHLSENQDWLKLLSDSMPHTKADTILWDREPSSTFDESMSNSMSKIDGNTNSVGLGRLQKSLAAQRTMLMRQATVLASLAEQADDNTYNESDQDSDAIVMIDGACGVGGA
jgi:hypothetical protein